jgi:hypothetical protein
MRLANYMSGASNIDLHHHGSECTTDNKQLSVPTNALVAIPEELETLDADTVHLTDGSDNNNNSSTCSG